jgi:hypothetical protein
LPYKNAESRREAQRLRRATEAGRTLRIAERKTDASKTSKARQKARQARLAHTFTGVDGEGWTDDYGDHHYMTLTVGNQTLYTGQPLTSWECLYHLATLPVEEANHYVSFFFDYDVTMILRDMAREDPDLAKTLFIPKEPGKMVWWKGIGIDYRPHKHLAVKLWTDDRSSKVVTIHDVQGFYQSAFIKALDQFSIGTEEEREHIRRMKAERSDFTHEQAEEIIAYSELECKLLALLVGNMRDAGDKTGINLFPYEGPGIPAGRELSKHFSKDYRERLQQSTPSAVWDMANRAYYGGRFEITAHGPITGTVYEYDLKSAYPAAMLKLPCLEHAKWSRGIHEDATYWVAQVEFRQYADRVGGACALPIRDKQGRIYYPFEGHGWYWSVELANLERKNYDVLSAWSLISHCDCKPFEWVRELYERRAAMELVEAGSGIVLKLILNSLYGKLAQRNPVIGPHYNLIYAGLITAITRALVYKVYVDHPGKVLMFATDAVFTTVKCRELKLGTGLGDWELAHTFTDLCIFQPGVYFDGLQAAFKTRGIPKRIFIDHAEQLRENSTDPMASIPVAAQAHLSLRLALARGTESAMAQMGNWVDLIKNMRADPSAKRYPEYFPTPIGLRSRIPQNRNKPMRTGGWQGTTCTYALAMREEVDGLLSDTDMQSDGYYEGEF